MNTVFSFDAYCCSIKLIKELEKDKLRMMRNQLKMRNIGTEQDSK